MVRKREVVTPRHHCGIWVGLQFVSLCATCHFPQCICPQPRRVSYNPVGEVRPHKVVVELRPASIAQSSFLRPRIVSTRSRYVFPLKDSIWLAFMSSDMCTWDACTEYFHRWDALVICTPGHTSQRLAAHLCGIRCRQNMALRHKLTVNVGGIVSGTKHQTVIKYQPCTLGLLPVCSGVCVVVVDPDA